MGADQAFGCRPDTAGSAIEKTFRTYAPALARDRKYEKRWRTRSYPDVAVFQAPHSTIGRELVSPANPTTDLRSKRDFSI
jgi:hypothetical protein